MGPRGLLIGGREAEQEREQKPTLPYLRTWVIKYVDQETGQHVTKRVQGHSIEQIPDQVWVTTGWIENGAVRAGTTFATKGWYFCEEDQTARVDINTTPGLSN